MICATPRSVGVTHLECIETLLAEAAKDSGVRVPGARRAALAAHAKKEGVDVPQALLDDLARRAGDAR